MKIVYNPITIIRFIKATRIFIIVTTIIMKSVLRTSTILLLSLLLMNTIINNHGVYAEDIAVNNAPMKMILEINGTLQELILQLRH